MVVALCATLAATYLWAGDITLAGACVTLWPPVLWVIALLPPVLWAWLRGDRKGAAIATAALAVFLAVSVETASVVRTSSPEPVAPDRRIRVVTWNVAGGAPYGDLAGVAPDVVFVQEAGSPPPASGVSAHQWTPAPDLALLTRWPVRVVATESVGPWAAPQLALLALPEGRQVLLANVRLALPSVVTAFANGDWRDLGTAHTERVAQYARVAALIARARAEHGELPAILAGDFNVPGGARSLAPLRRVLHDAWAEGGRGWGGTMTAALPLARIDQIWVSPDVRVTAARVLPRGGSDHRAVVADLQLD